MSKRQVAFYRVFAANLAVFCAMVFLGDQDPQNVGIALGAITGASLPFYFKAETDRPSEVKDEQI